MWKNLIAWWRPAACLVAASIAITGCGGGSSGQELPTSNADLPGQTTTNPPASQPTALSLKGNPASSATVGSAYSFAPSVTASNGSNLTYSVQNKPSWAAFDTASGTLSGTPAASDVGTYANIVITVSDGTMATSLPGFTITVSDVANGTATVSWAIPTTNSDGTPLTNLAGFRIYYGTAASSMTQFVQITNPGVSTYVITSLGPATWFFGVKAYTSGGSESAISNIASKTIT